MTQIASPFVRSLRPMAHWHWKIPSDFQFRTTNELIAIYGVYLSWQQKAASESTLRGSYMFKFVFSAVVCAAMCLPAATLAQDCGCEPAPAPCVKTRKRLKLVDVQQQVCKVKHVCTTDECGCQKSKLVRYKECVTRKKLTLVDTPVDPCRKGILSRLKSRMGSLGCCNSAPEPCGCEAPAPAPCGCDAAPEPAPCGCDAAPAMEYSAPAMEYSAPMAVPTPAAAPCCGG